MWKPSSNDDTSDNYVASAYNPNASIIMDESVTHWMELTPFISNYLKWVGFDFP